MIQACKRWASTHRLSARETCCKEMKSGKIIERGFCCFVESRFDGHGQKLRSREQRDDREKRIRREFTFFRDRSVWYVYVREKRLFASTRNWRKSGFWTKSARLERKKWKMFHKRWFYKVNRLSFNEPLKTIGCSRKVHSSEKWIFQLIRKWRYLRQDGSQEVVAGKWQLLWNRKEKRWNSKHVTTYDRRAFDQACEAMNFQRDCCNLCTKSVEWIKRNKQQLSVEHEMVRNTLEKINPISDKIINQIITLNSFRIASWFMLKMNNQCWDSFWGLAWFA